MFLLPHRAASFALCHAAADQWANVHHYLVIGLQDDWDQMIGATHVECVEHKKRRKVKYEYVTVYGDPNDGLVPATSSIMDTKMGPYTRNVEIKGLNHLEMSSSEAVRNKLSEIFRYTDYEGGRAFNPEVDYALPTPPKPTPDPTPATINGASSVYVGNTITLTCSNTSAHFNASSGQYASVSTAGLPSYQCKVTGTKEGQITVYAYLADGSECASKTITIKASAAPDPTPERATIIGPNSVSVGKKITLTCSNMNAIFDESMGQYAAVTTVGVSSYQCRVTGINAGTITVTARLNGSVCATKLIAILP